MDAQSQWIVARHGLGVMRGYGYLEGRWLPAEGDIFEPQWSSISLCARLLGVIGNIHRFAACHGSG